MDNMSLESIWGRDDGADKHSLQWLALLVTRDGWMDHWTGADFSKLEEEES